MGIVAALSASAVVAAAAYGLRAWQADEPWMAAAGIGSLIALMPLRAWFQRARQPLCIQLDQGRGEALWLAAGNDAAPMQLAHVGRSLDGGHWMLLRLQAEGSRQAHHRFVAQGGDAAGWPGLRRAILAAESRRSAP